MKTAAADYTTEYAEVARGLTHTSMELVCLLNVQGDHAAATMVAELADRVQDALKAVALVAEVYLR